MNWKNKRTLSFLFWVILVVVMLVVMPDLDKLVLEKGQTTIPETSQSEKGTKLLNELKTNGEDTFTFALVFHNESALSDQDIAEVENVLQEINADADSLNILDSLFHIDSEQAKDQLVAEDGTTILAQLSIQQKSNTAEEVAQKLRGYLEEVSFDTYVTGSDIVLSDFAQSSQEGVKKTEIIAIIFIIIILIAIFRSPVIPIISLVTVGVSYIVSLSIVALLVEHTDFPFSNFTQVFLVVILFGIGTDYNILLFTRFKEELAKQGHVLKAIATTYKTAGKTVIYSGLAVLVGFTALFFAQFSLYQATAAVSIGVAVLLLVLLTLNPFFMGVFGFKMFWPIKEVKGHSDNKMWAFLSKFAFIRPFLSIIIVAIITVPFIWNYSNELNYNDLVEIDDKYESKQAIGIIEQHYDAGFSSPLSLVIKADETLATQADLAEIDELSGVIQQIDGVAKVYSVTRPEGKRIDELYIDEQSGQLKEGLGTAQDGVSQINEGLSNAEQEVSKPQDLSGVQQLIDGTNALGAGASQLQQALNTLSSGIGDGVDGARQLDENLEQLTTSIATLKEGLASLSSNYTALSNGFGQYNQLLASTATAIQGAKQGYEQIESLMTPVAAQNPESVEIQTTLQIAKQAQSDLDALSIQLAGATEQYAKLTSGLTQANSSLQTAVSAASQMEQGAIQLSQGAGTLANGLQQAQNGSSQIANESTALVTGISAVNEGQTKLQKSLEQLQDKMSELSKGLKETTDGLDEIYDGLDEANSYLTDLNASEVGKFFIPQEVLDSEDFQGSLNAYMNEDRNLTSMTIILDVNPYTEEAMEIAKQIDEKVQSYVASSTLAEDEVYLTGKTMANVDLQQISQGDLIRSIIFIMVGIALILLWITRSFFQTIIIIGSLLVTNYTAIGLTEIITSQFLGHEALSWNVPFFSMMMIITLGVDYSIFLMMRYNETRELGLSQIMPAAASMGGVIISAAIILGGTFAALIPSGIMTLLQVAIAVMIGLLLLSIIIMPILLPACFGLVNKVQNLMKKSDPPA